MNEWNAIELPDCVNLEIGAHLISPRRGYVHHGIYAGAASVVHYAGLSLTSARHRFRYGPIEEVGIAEFAQGHGVSWLPEPHARFQGEAVVRRARSRLGEDRYRLLTNNCEHFCNWCLFDEHRSIQVERFLQARAVMRAGRVGKIEAALA